MIIALQGAKEFRFRPIRTFLEFNIVKIQNYLKFHPILEILNSNSESESLIAHFQSRSIHILIPTNCATINLRPVEHPESHPKTSRDDLFTDEEERLDSLRVTRRGDEERNTVA